MTKSKTPTPAIPPLAPTSKAIQDPKVRRTDLEGLHPVMRKAVIQVLSKLEQEKLPFRIYEAYRSPIRQAWLYGKGRTAPGDKVTNARAWQSYHQYGLAVDFVLNINGTWSWQDTGEFAAYWDRLAVIGTEAGLEKLSWEKPHLQLAGLQLRDLMAGLLPAGADDLWRDNLEAAALTWTGPESAIVLAVLRPPLPKTRAATQSA